MRAVGASNQTSGSVGWSNVATAYAETFAALCAGTFAEVLTAAGIRERVAPRVLDVGTGTGGLAALAAQTGAVVTAVDPDPEMLRIAERVAPDALLLEAGLPALPFRDGDFDAVLANFVVNHLRDPRRGMSEIVRVAAPGAPVVVTIWPSGRNAQSLLWAAVIEASGAVVPQSVGLPEDKDFPRTREGLTDLLASAGLRDVQASSLRWTHRAAADSMWQGAAAGIGGIGTIVTSQSVDVRKAMRTAYDRLVVDLTVDGRLRLDTEALLAVGITT